jgi:hypothetical protein
MNCQDICRLLAEGKSLPSEAHHHIEGCRFCQALVQTDFQTQDGPRNERMENYKRIVRTELAAVRPMPSDGTLRLTLVILFLCITALATLRTGFAGLHVLTVWQMALYFGVILLAALFGAGALVQEMIPGARRYLNARAALLLQCVVLLGVVAVLFHSLSFARFVASGHGCFQLGTVCAAASALVFAFVLKDGFFASPVRTGVIAGFFSGLAGFAVLAVHCPVLSIPHIWVWHFGVVPVSMAAGALIGYALQKLWTARNF